ncbi:hypothetical protein EWI07_03995 [Sporolactobacillus sp. THM7-4]|nr:hypothetical protein EWI07_03995 [Sporolactobacillus sp. THM7-4]
MSLYLMPFSLLVKHYFTDFNGQLAELPIYLMISCVIIYLIQGNKVYFHSIIRIKSVICLFVFLTLQLVAVLISYAEIGNSIYNVKPFIGYMNFIKFLMPIILIYFLVRTLVNKRRDIHMFLFGSFISTIIILFVTYTQLLSSLMPQSSLLNNLTSFYGYLFEARNLDVPEWYVMGSYVQTLGRVNGFFSESGMLAAYLSIVCLPFIMSAIKNKNDIFLRKKYNPLMYYSLFLLIIGILLLAKTSTGLVAILVIFLLMLKSMPPKRKITVGLLIVCILGFIIILYYKNQHVSQLINYYTFERSDSSSNDNRIGGTLGLIISIMHRPFLGTGFSYLNYYLNEYIPDWSRNNFEFYQFTTIRHSFPIMSNLFGWMCQFGTIVVIGFIIYILRLSKEIKLLIKIINNPSEYFYFQTIYDAMSLSVLLFFILSLLGFVWSEPGYLILFFFFVSFRQYLKRQYNSQNISKASVQKSTNGLNRVAQ